MDIKSDPSNLELHELARAKARVSTSTSANATARTRAQALALLTNACDGAYYRSRSTNGIRSASSNPRTPLQLKGNGGGECPTNNLKDGTATQDPTTTLTAPLRKLLYRSSFCWATLRVAVAAHKCKRSPPSNARLQIAHLPPRCPKHSLQRQTKPCTISGASK